MRLISRRLGPEEELQNSPNSIRANGLAAFGILGPYTLLANFGPSVGGVDHDAFADENADVRHAILAVAVRGPEEHVTGLGFCAGEMLAEAGVILRLRSTRDSVVAGSADGILRESGAVVAAVGFALASSTSKDVLNAFLSFGRGYNVGAGAVRRRRGFGAIHTALFDANVSQNMGVGTDLP